MQSLSGATRPSGTTRTRRHSSRRMIQQLQRQSRHRLPQPQSNYEVGGHITWTHKPGPPQLRHCRRCTRADAESSCTKKSRTDHPSVPRMERETSVVVPRSTPELWAPTGYRSLSRASIIPGNQKRTSWTSGSDSRAAKHFRRQSCIDHETATVAQTIPGDFTTRRDEIAVHTGQGAKHQTVPRLLKSKINLGVGPDIDSIGCVQRSPSSRFLQTT